MPHPASLSSIPLFSAPGTGPIVSSPPVFSQLSQSTAPNPVQFGSAQSNPLEALHVHLPTISVGPNSIPIPQKVLHKIWGGEFIDMAELLPEKLGPSHDPQKASKRPKRTRVANILQWVECFSAYVSVILAKQPTRASDLLAYMALIAHAARKYKGDGWIQYDVNFRKRAAAFPAERWADINPTIWQLAFANAEPRSHCELCFSLDHTTEQCDDYEPPASSSGSKASSGEATPKRKPICLKWNRYECHSATCEFQHICVECHQQHKAKDCSMARRYSPYRDDRYRGARFEDKEFRRRRQSPPGKGKQPFRKQGPTFR